MKVSNLLIILAGYAVLGFLFDYALYLRNAPTGVPYAPNPTFVAGWPYYLTQINK